MPKIYIFLISFLFTAQITTAQFAPQTQWSKCYGGTSDDRTNCIIEAHNEGYIMAGSTYSKDGSISDTSIKTGWVAKLNKQGGIDWQKRYGGDSSGYIMSIAKHPNGGYVFAASVNKIGSSIWQIRKWDYWVVMINDTGKIVWEKTFGGSNNDFADGIVVDKTGNIIVGGTSFSNDGDVQSYHGTPPAETVDIWLIKLNSNGNLIWEKCFGGSSDEGFIKMKLTADNGYIVTGNASSNDGDVSGVHYGRSSTDAWVFKADSNGVLQWQRACGGGFGEALWDLEITNDGGCLLVGQTNSNDGDVVGYHETPDSLKERPEDVYFDGWIVKLNKYGKLEWQKCLGSPLGDGFISVAKTSDNGFFVNGTSLSKVGDFPKDKFDRRTSLLKIDERGHIIWQKHIGGAGFYGNWFYDILIDKDNCIVGGGISESKDFDCVTNHDTLYDVWDGWVMKFYPEPIPIRVVANTNLNIYPNPASNVTYIATQNIKEIKLIDALGRVYLNKKIDNTNNAGFYYLPLNYIANGTYMVQAIDNNGLVNTGKLIVVK